MPSMVVISPFCVPAGISNSISLKVMVHESDFITCLSKSRGSVHLNS